MRAKRWHDDGRLKRVGIIPENFNGAGGLGRAALNLMPIFVALFKVGLFDSRKLRQLLGAYLAKLGSSDIRQVSAHVACFDRVQLVSLPNDSVRIHFLMAGLFLR